MAGGYTGIQSGSDTIVAQATAQGKAAIAIVRLSGRLARYISEQMTTVKERKASHEITEKAQLNNGQSYRDSCRNSHQLCHVTLYNQAGGMIDDAMVVEMHAPRSYTGEDVVEFHLHGAQIVVQQVIASCMYYGARMAGAGEFSLRAFLNDKLSLAQAESVGQLLAATSERQARIAARHVSGQLSLRVEALLKVVEGVLSEWRSTVDFPDFVPEEVWSPDLLQGIQALYDVEKQVGRLLERAQVDLYRGAEIVLCGAPNVGKSTLLNAWAGEERVLVDDVPGTTRDPIELLLGGDAGFMVCDTAGLHDTKVAIEGRGIGMTRQRIATASLAVWLLDPTAPTWPSEKLLSGAEEVGMADQSGNRSENRAKPVGLEDDHIVVVASKMDLADDALQVAIEKEAIKKGFPIFAWISAASHEGVDELQERLSKRLVSGANDATVMDHTVVDIDSAKISASDHIVVTEQRHVDALSHAKRSLEELREGVEQEFPIDLLSAHLEETARHLGGILGRNVDAAVLDQIFARFCIGK